VGAGSNAAIAAAASQAIAATQQVCMFNDNITFRDTRSITIICFNKRIYGFPKCRENKKKLLSMLRFCFQDTYLLEIKVRHLKSNP